MAFIQEKVFSGGINLPASIMVQGGVDGEYVIAANQIAWGAESEFNGKNIESTQALLGEIESLSYFTNQRIDQIVESGIDESKFNDAISYYLENNDLNTEISNTDGVFEATNGYFISGVSVEKRSDSVNDYELKYTYSYVDVTHPYNSASDFWAEYVAEPEPEPDPNPSEAPEEEEQ